MNKNHIVFKSNSMKSENHYITHTEYIKKDDAIIFYEATEKDRLEVINLQRKRLGEKMGKKGRPPQIAKDLIFSIPPELENDIKDFKESDFKRLIDTFIDTVLKDISKYHKKADISFLRKKMTVVCHRDSDHSHFHCNIPAFTKHKGLLSKELIAIDYGQLKISANARKKMFNEFQKIKGEKVEEMTIEEFQEASKSKRANKSKSWAKRKRAIQDEEVKQTQRAKRLESQSDELKKEIEQTREQAKQLKEEYQRALNDLNTTVRAKVEKLLLTAEKQLENGNTQRANKTIEKVKATMLKNQR